MITPVFKTVREGEDVLTASEDKFTINSLRNQLKKSSVIIGVLEFPARTTSSYAYVIIVHNLGYTPIVEAYAKGEDDTYWKPFPHNLDGDGATIRTGTIQGENETILAFYNFSPEVSWDAQDIDYKYNIYIDPSKEAWDE